MCRTRRIKCDETKPTCNQCAKSRRQCPGYKDDFDLVFRNETQATERRARRTLTTGKQSNIRVTIQNPHPALSSAPNDGSNLTITSTSGADMAMALASPMSLSIPIEQQAPCYFMSNFVLAPSNDAGTPRGYFDFLAPLMKNEHPDSQLASAFSAVAMASLANRPNSKSRKELKYISVMQYAKALKATNLALQDPSKQKTDQTLAAILMLGFYETVCTENTNPSAWYSHIDGAVQIVKLRGKKQLRTKVGNALFQVVRTQMAITCMTASKSPELGPDWWVADSVSDDFGVPVTKIQLELAELRAEVNNALTSFPRTPEYFAKVTGFIRRAELLEQEYYQWEASLPASWKPRTVAWVDNVAGADISKAEVCPGKVEVYTSIWVGTTWNHARSVRINISGTITRCAAWICSPVDYRTTPEYAHGIRLCSDLATDILSSIPYHLGWDINKGGAVSSSDFSSFTSGLDAFRNPKGIGGFFALWPIFAVSCTDYITDAQRAWAKARMRYIGDSMGMNHAKVLAGFQLRLPSMIIRRDNIGHSPPSTQTAPAMTRGVYSPPTAPPSGATPPFPHPSFPISYASSATTRISATVYALDPLQQREAMQKETFERERALLLKKASNSQGEAVEKLLAVYLAV
ncbi:Zn2 DNA-binding protein [Venustampulla echinocandica]|uniref:Zn2 DNA-binding protein n=1 Tax=Venustampulla echinocandica TaxID=2656787 RepID=A0A370TC10_9HELO|nr:Zn2 DNA-binding protein [Venustampulla echinocandica]RDL31790.1 Zn2 DNA-binding protein [Venustampulla echinocandica]